MLSRTPDRRPPRVLNPYIQAPASTSTYDGRTTRPIPTSPPVSVPTDRGVFVPARASMAAPGEPGVRRILALAERAL